MLPVSREGLLWFLISFAMLVTGLFKGINLITLLACWMVTLVLLNYCWAYPQLRSLEVGRLFPDPVFAGTPSSMLLQVHNRGRRTAYGVTLHDRGAAHDVSRFLPRLSAGATATLSLSLEAPARGLYQLLPVEATTGYPLALVHLSREIGTGHDLVVFPRLGQLRRGALRRFLAQYSPTLGQARAFPRRHPAAQTEFHGLRPFRAGDSPRWIHWRTTARRGELMVREFEDMPNDHLVLIVEPGQPAPAVLERLLSLASTICWDWCRQKGDRLGLALAGPEPSIFVGTTGTPCATVMLERLALATAGPLNDRMAFLDGLGNAELPPGPILVLGSTASDLADAVAQYLHRSVASLNLESGADQDFFEE